LESFFGRISAENRSFASNDVARMALVMVRIAWGRTSSRSDAIISDPVGIAPRERESVVIGGNPCARIPAAIATMMTAIDERSGTRKWYATRNPPLMIIAPSKKCPGSGMRYTTAVLSRIRASPSWIPRTTGSGIYRSIISRTLVKPMRRKMAPRIYPAAAISPPDIPAATAMTAMAFMGSTGTGYR